MKNKPKRILRIISLLLLLIGIIAISNSRLVRMIWENMAAPTDSFDETTIDSTWSGGQILSDIRYGRNSEIQKLTLHLPDDRDQPLAIVLYGGGACMNDNTSRQVMMMADYFRNHGFACAAVNYRLAGEAKAPAAIEDVKASIRFLRYHAEEYGYDPEKMVISGESTGAYLGIMAALSGEDEFSSVQVAGVQNAKEISSQVAAIVDFYGTMDMFHQEADFSDTHVPAWIREIAGSWFNQYLPDGITTYQEYWIGKPVEEITAKERQYFSPYHYIFEHPERVKELAVWISHGGADISVDYTQSDDLFYRLLDVTDHPERIHYELYPSWKHADDRFFTEESMKEISDFLLSYL